MRTRLVFWGKSSKEERVLIAFKLNEEENNVEVYIFPESTTTEDFVTQMHDHWRNGQDILFPQGHEQQKKPLSITESLVPEGFTVEREDILKRAQTEWQFIVLSAKLYKSYRDELEDFRDKYKKLVRFDSGLFEELKGFWSKVQEQVREKNLFRDHANQIREQTDELFSDLKQMRKALDEEFKELSEQHLNKFKDQLVEIEKKIDEGLSLQNIFQELKDIQNSFRKTKFTNDHRSQVWKKLDGLFKTVKEKKFGPSTNRNASPLERLNRRYDGLVAAIEKMERSIQRDKKDLAFENKRMENSDGSLESQLRAAKTKMIAERIRSKEAKLGEMHKTKIDLERRREHLIRKQEKAAKERQVKDEIKEKIAQEIKEAERAREGDENLQKASKLIQEENVSIEDHIEDGIENIVDTIKAVAVVVEDNVKKWVADLTEEE